MRMELVKESRTSGKGFALKAGKITSFLIQWTSGAEQLLPSIPIRFSTAEIAYPPKN